MKFEYKVIDFDVQNPSFTNDDLQQVFNTLGEDRWQLSCMMAPYHTSPNILICVFMRQLFHVEQSELVELFDSSL